MHTPPNIFVPTIRNSIKRFYVIKQTKSGTLFLRGIKCVVKLHATTIFCQNHQNYKLHVLDQHGQQVTEQNKINKKIECYEQLKKICRLF